MSVKVFKQENKQGWENDLSNFNGSLFLTCKFLYCLEDDTKKAVFFKFTKESKTVAVLSGLEVPVGNTNMKQLFFFSGIASIKEKKSELISECKKSLLSFARNNGYSRLLFESYDDINFIRIKVKKYKTARGREEYVIDLLPEKDHIINGFSNNVRKLANRVKDKGAVFKCGQSKELLEKLFDLLEQTHKERILKGYGEYNPISMPFLDKNMLLKLLQFGFADILYIEFQGKIVCMQYILASSLLAYGLFMGTSKEGYRIGAPSMLMFDSTIFYKEKNFIRFNLGGVPMEKRHQGVKKFKLSMGAKVIKSNQEYSKFLLPPLTRLNSILTVKGHVSNMRIPWMLKKRLIALTDLLLKGTDRY